MGIDVETVVSPDSSVWAKFGGDNPGVNVAGRLGSSSWVRAVPSSCESAVLIPPLCLLSLLLGRLASGTC